MIGKKNQHGTFWIRSLHFHYLLIVFLQKCVSDSSLLAKIDFCENFFVIFLSRVTLPLNAQVLQVYLVKNALFLSKPELSWGLACIIDDAKKILERAASRAAFLLFKLGETFLVH